MKFVISKTQYCNRRGGSSGSTCQSILTNRPEAVRVSAFGPEMQDYRDARDASGSGPVYRFAEVEIDETVLRDGDFVAIRKVRHNSDCRGNHYGETITHVAGREVSKKDFDFGTAYAEWAEYYEREALNYLRALAADKPRRVKHSLEFAALGGSSGMAPHAQRREAWRAALKGCGLKGETVSRTANGSVRTATVKAGLRLGWKPSVPAPKFWEGLPTGVTEVVADSSDKGEQWIKEAELREFWDREWRPVEEAA